MAYVATLVKQKDDVEEIQKKKVTASRELEGIVWSDRVLQERLNDIIAEA
jgi:hypothetical protein